MVNRCYLSPGIINGLIIGATLSLTANLLEIIAQTALNVHLSGRHASQNLYEAVLSL